jgi:Skp family chaperone for outer membrane proteins
MTFTDWPLAGTIPPRGPGKRAIIPARRAATRRTPHRKCRGQDDQQQARSAYVRFLPVCATFVAGPLSVFFLVAPVAAQVLPAGPRPSGPPTGAIAPGGPAMSAPAPAPSAPAGGTSVAVIDVAYIFKTHARFNQSMSDMKRDIEAFDAHMQEESKKLQKKQEEMQAFGPSSPQFKKLDEELAKMKSDFQITVQSKKRDFLEQEAKVYYNIYREVEEAVIVFAQRHGIRLVLRFTGDEMKPDDRASVLQGVNKPVLYQDHLDITMDILSKLNAGATVPPGGGVAPPVGPGSPIQPPDRNARPPQNGPIIPPGQPGRTVPR